MIYRELTLKEINPRLPEPKTPCRIYAYLHELSENYGRPDHRRPAVIVVPGGGYYFTSDREAEPIVFQFLAEGYNVFLLRYSIEPERYPTSLLQLTGLISHIRLNADKYNVMPDKIATCGFSAGSHLSASAGILWKEPVVSETLGVDGRLCRQDAMILSYPVVNSHEFAHRRSFDFLLGKNRNDEQWLNRMSLETRVHPDVPPAFIWHTYSDELVPVENSLLLATALRKANVPFELHIFPDGVHGLSLANEFTRDPNRNDHIEPAVQCWIDLAKIWLEGIFEDKE